MDNFETVTQIKKRIRPALTFRILKKNDKRWAKERKEEKVKEWGEKI